MNAVAVDSLVASGRDLDRPECVLCTARGDTYVCLGHAAWKNLRTLRTVSGPKVDVWTARDGLAVHYLEMFDSYGCARAIGVGDPPTG